MSHRFADITFTDSVKNTQDQYGSRVQNERLQHDFGPNDRFTAREIDFISKRDTFYMATVSDTGWPYVQHRGGPVGFLRVVDPNLLAYADFRGNKQLISIGNLSANERCSIILIDYPKRRRLKILGKIRVEEAESMSADGLSQVDIFDYKARVERIVFIELVAFDWNCPQHITKRYTVAEWADMNGKPLTEFR